MLVPVAQVCFLLLWGITFLVIRKPLSVCLYMWVVQVDFDFFGSCAGGIPLLLPRDGPVLPWRTLHPTVWPLQPCCILQWGASPSLITTPAWGRETAHPRGPNNCCYRQTRDRGHHQHLPHTTGLKKVHKPSNQL